MSQVPTAGLPKPRYSGIPSAGKSGLPAPGIRARSTANSTPPPVTPTDSPVSSRITGEPFDAKPANRFMGRVSNASTIQVSPDATRVKSSYAAPKASPSYSRSSFSSAGPRTSIGRPPSSASASSSRYGDRSVPVTPPRKQTNGYTPNSAVKIGSTSRSSVTSRSESRVSDALTRNSSRASQRPLEVGDPVKIESLNLEGTLRFLGEIQGKPGHWAGVELSGQYAGKGKNDGSAAGVSYFSCPPKCGVFVASNKITPIVAPSPAVVRPPSAASSHGASALTSPTEARKRKVTSAEASLLAQSKISAGSRASKYIGMTARQLSTRDQGQNVKSPTEPSPIKLSARPGSPPRLPTSIVTQTTPKAPRASLGLKRPSVPTLNTPRPSRAQLSNGRNDEMPPPPVPNKEPVTPITPASAGTSFTEESLIDVNSIVISNAPSPSPSPSQSGRSSIYATPSPEPSHLVEIQRLQSLVQTLEEQNKELQDSATTNKTPDDTISKAALEQAEQEKSAALLRVTDLESSLRTSERTSTERQSKVEALERQLEEVKKDVTLAKSEGETRVKEMQAKVEDSETLVSNLKGLIDAKASAASENDAALAAKQAEIEMLQTQVSRLTVDLQEERKELGGTIEDLRRAGQETIALYEERISAFEAERYDMETVVQALEEKLKTASHQPSHEEMAEQVSTVAQIDNETLREQVAQFQQRIQHLEDQLEEAQVAAEREEAAIQNRIGRYKEKDSQRQKELEEAHRLAASTAKSESAAKARIDELEAALRENTTALEDARAEIECLRTEVTNLENSTEVSGGDLRPSNEQTLQTEAKHLKALLDASKSETRATAIQLEAAKSQAEESTLLVKDLRDLIESLEKEKAELQKTLQARSKEDAKRSRDSTSSISSRTKDDTLRDQISGLKIMMQELQKENSAAAAKIRSLETENKTLTKEAEDLKESIKTLEAAVDESIQREERMLAEESGDTGAGGDDPAAQRAVREARIELDQCRKKLADVEKKSSRTISELNKEVADLESLVEAKIYREDDLEREVERLKEKVQKLQSKSSSSKSHSSADALAKSSSRSNHTRNSTVTQSTVSPQESSGAVCEICEQSGHDVFSCPLLRDDGPATTPSTEVYCVDCDSRTHDTAECPHAQDVF